MTGVGTWPPSPASPPGRALNGWWRELAPCQPQRLWFTHLLLHRVEALAAIIQTKRPDAFQLALLRLLSTTTNGCTAGSLDHAHVDRQLLYRCLSALASQGLLAAQGSDWVLTDAGRSAVATGVYTQPGLERRAFYFVDQGDMNRPAHFLHLSRPALPYPAHVNFCFDPRWLEDCLRQPLEWKVHHQFPADVEAVVTATPGNKAPLSWREVVLDRPEHLLVAVIQTAPGFHGFQVQPEDWKLRAEEPVFTLGEGWQEVLPDLAQEPAPDLWRAAWQGWCRQRSLPPAETDGCSLRRQDHWLEVRASKRLFDRFKATRSDVLQGETWLLAGKGRTRSAACVKVLEGEG
jgi:hypothetical protein